MRDMVVVVMDVGVNVGMAYLSEYQWRGIPRLDPHENCTVAQLSGKGLLVVDSILS